MEIVVIGSHEFTLGFQLAGVTRLYHPSSDKEMESSIRGMSMEVEFICRNVDVHVFEGMAVIRSKKVIDIWR